MFNKIYCVKIKLLNPDLFEFFQLLGPPRAAGAKGRRFPCGVWGSERGAGQGACARSLLKPCAWRGDVVRSPWCGPCNAVLEADATKAVWGNGYKNAGWWHLSWMPQNLPWVTWQHLLPLKWSDPPLNPHPPYESMPVKPVSHCSNYEDAWACGGSAHRSPPVRRPPQVFVADGHSQAHHAPAFPTPRIAKDSKVKASPQGSPHTVMD